MGIKEIAAGRFDQIQNTLEYELNTLKRASVYLLMAFAITASALSQSVTNRPHFEVISVKRNTSGDFRATSTTRGGRFVATNYTLRRLVQFAFSQPERPLLRDQTVGGPAWIDKDHFDVEGRSESDVSIAPDQVRLMLQSALEDRFALKIHRDTVERPAYNLLVLTSGRLKLSVDQSAAATNTAPAATGALSRGAFGIMADRSTLVLSGTAIPISTLITLLQSQVGRIVIDNTGLRGLFDVRLTFAPVTNSVEAPEGGAKPTEAHGADGPYDVDPSIFTALQEQLGLRLNSTKAAVDVVVIDGAQQPSSN